MESCNGRQWEKPCGTSQAWKKETVGEVKFEMWAREATEGGNLSQARLSLGSKRAAKT